MKLKNNLNLTKFNLELNQELTTSKPNHFIFGIDVSGSMYRELEKIKDHFTNQVATSLNIGDYITIIYYSSNNDAGYVLEKFKYEGLDSLNAIKRSIQILRPRSLTGFVDPLKMAYDVCGESETNIFVFMSDGYENQNSKVKIISETERLSEAIDYGYVVEYGNYANHDLLVEMGDILGTQIFSKDASSFNVKVSEFITNNYASSFVEVEHVNAIQVFYIKDGMVVGVKSDNDIYKIPQNNSYYVLDNIDNTNKDFLVEGLLGLIYLNQTNPNEVWTYLEALGSVSLIDMYSVSVGKQKLNDFYGKVLFYLKDNSDLYAEGKDFNYLPAEDQFCLIDLLNIINENEVLIYTRDDRFKYNRIGAKSVQTSTLIENPYEINFDYKNKIEKGNALSLAYNSNRANIGFNVRKDVVVDLSPANNEKVPQQIESNIYRTYNIVSDLILNVDNLVISCDEEVLSKFPEEVYTVDNGRVILHLNSIPISNRNMIKNTNLKDLAEAYLDNKLVGYKQKVFNSLAKEYDVKSYQNPIVDQYGKEVADELKELGITTNGFNPKVTKMAGEDVYYAPSFSVKIPKYDSIPTLAKVIAKVNDKGEDKLTNSETIMYGFYKMYLEFKNTNFYKMSDDKDSLILNFIKTEKESVVKHKREIMYNISKQVFNCLLGKVKVDSEEFTFNKMGLEFKVIVDQKEVEVKL